MEAVLTFHGWKDPLMQSSPFIAEPTHRVSWPAPRGSTVQHKTASARKLLIYLFSAESADAAPQLCAPLSTPWAGPLKALLWTTLSIVAGMLLAHLFS